MDTETFQQYMNIYESQIKMRILNYLHIYKELSLTELSGKLGKSKSTISKHIQEMQRIEIQGEKLVDVRERKYRGSIEQKMYSLGKIPLFIGKTYDDLKSYSPDQIFDYLHIEEYMINMRFFSLLKDIMSRTLEYINEFYSNLTPKDIDEDFKEKIYQYNTCIPRIQYYSTDEYIEYRHRFLKFEDDFLAEIEKKRKIISKSTSKPQEYLVYHVLLPVRRILDKEYR